MVRYTINTGRSVRQSRKGLSAKTFRALRPLVGRGGVIPEFSGFRTEVNHAPGAAMFTVWRRGKAVVTCALAWTKEGEAQAWPAITRLYFAVAELNPELVTPVRRAKQPRSRPWLAVVEMPLGNNQLRKDIRRLDRFERSMALTILRERTGV